MSFTDDNLNFYGFEPWRKSDINRLHYHVLILIWYNFTLIFKNLKLQFIFMVLLPNLVKTWTNYYQNRPHHYRAASKQAVAEGAFLTTALALQHMLWHSSQRLDINQSLFATWTSYKLTKPGTFNNPRTRNVAKL